MNNKTLKHLNTLLNASVPLQLDPDFRPILPYPPESITRPLWEQLLAIAKKYKGEMIAREIREAAAERRTGETVSPEYRWDWAFRYSNGIPWTATKQLWRLASAEISAAITADNARRAAEYEAYRIACAQGVAVPPADQ